MSGTAEQISDNLLRLRFIQGVSMAPDGRSAAVTVFWSEPSVEKDLSRLGVIDLMSGSVTWLTDGESAAGHPAWSPDGKRIAFVGGSGTARQLRVAEVDDGSVAIVSGTAQQVVGRPVWSPDSTKVAFSGRLTSAARDPRRPYRIDRRIYRFDGLGYFDEVCESIFVADVSSGETSQVTHDRYHNTQPVWAPDGGSLIFLSAFAPAASSWETTLRRADFDGHVEVLPSPQGVIPGLESTPDGRLVFVLKAPHGTLPGSDTDLYVLDPSKGSWECRTDGMALQFGGELIGDSPVGPTQRVLVPNREVAIVTAQRRGMVDLYEVRLNGTAAIRPMVTGAGTCYPLGWSGGRVLCFVSDFNEPGQLAWADPGRAELAKIVEFNQREGLEIPRTEVTHLTFEGKDGTPVEGWFLRSQGSPGPAPTIVNIHGGPHAAFGHVFSCDAQVLVSAGFGVLQVNHRGSTGYGEKFATEAIGHRGSLDCEDVLAGVDYAVSEGLADENRIGLFGISGGGNLSCWLVGHTDRFKAAVAENPVTNFRSLYGTSDMGTYVIPAEMGGVPAEIPDVYAASSPITFAHMCTTPTLLIQGEDDYRARPEQSEQFYATLRANDCFSEMLVLPGGGHGGSRRGPVLLRAAQNVALVEWMRKFVLLN